MKSAVRFVAIVSLLAFGMPVPQVQGQAKASNTWSSAGQMTEGRSGAAAVQLQDGRILITGGTDSGGVPQTSAEVYDPSTGAFSALPAMNVPRANHAAVVLISGDVLVTGGLTTGGGYSDSAEIYSVSTNKWTLLQASIGTGLAGQTMVLLPDGNVLMAGGASTTKVVGSIILFNHTDQTFTPIGQLQTPRTNGAAAATPDGRVLIVGGADINGKVLASTEIFTYTPSAATGTIAAGPAMSSAREYATATSTYDGVAVIGGNNGKDDLGTAEIFSQWTNTFRVVTGGTARSHHFAIRLPNNGSILAMGGTGGTAVDLLEPWANAKAGAFVAAAASLVNQDGGFSTPASLGSVLAAGGTGSSASQAERYWFPTVSTQNPEYAPGMPVQMSGSGFKPNETVDLHIHLWVDQTTQDAPDATVTADASGNFTYNGYSPDSGDVGARYHLTAVGETSGYQAQTIFGDSASYIIFTNAPLDQSTTTCGALTLSVGGGSTPYGTFYLYDSTTTGKFYSNSICSTVITSVAFASNQSATIYYENTAASTPELMACSTNAGSEDGCELDQAFGTAFFTSQTETIYAPASKLGWLASPGNGAPGVALAPQPAVVVEDSVGHTVSASTAPITLALSTNPGGNLTCTSGLVLNATSGIAQFAGCAIDTAASTQYCLSATSPGLTSPTPTCFYITNAANAANSTVVASTSPATSPVTVVDNGTAYATITVTLKDASGNPVAGKTVVLTQGAGTSSAIGAASGVSSSAGVVTFRVTDGNAETVTYTAVDTSDNVVVAPSTATVIFQGGTVSTTNSTVTAAPATVTADGVSQSIITVTLNDTSTGGGNPVGGKVVTLTAGSGASVISVGGVVGNTATTNAYGQAIFTVTDATAQAVVYTAKDTTDSPNITVRQTATVTFVASTANTPVLTLTLSIAGPPYSAPYNSTFTVTASHTPTADPNTTSYSVTGNCTLAGGFGGNTVTMTATSGTCTVTAEIAASPSGGGGTKYNSATASVTVSATLATPATLTVTGAPASAVYNSTFTVGTSGGSGTGAITFAASGGCSNTGSLITMTSGTTACNITATQATDGTYLAQTSAPVTVQATTATGTITVSCPTVVYNGAAQSSCSATTTPTSLAAGVTYTYNGSTEPTNSASYTVVGTINDANYSGTGTATFVITPEPVTATGSNFVTAYTGSAITVPTACTLTVPGGDFNPPNLSCANSPTSIGPAVGVGALTPTVTATGGDTLTNYTITIVGGTWQITGAAVTVTAGGYTGVFDGNAHTPAPCVVSAPGGGSTGTVTCTDSPSPVGPNVGSGTVSPVPAVGAGDSLNNYTITEVTAPWGITPAPVTVTAGSYSGAYTGVAATIPGCTVTGTSPATFTGTVSCTNNPVSVGPAEGSGNVAPVAAVVSPDLLTNYTITTVDGTWSIGSITPTMSLVLDPGSSDPAPTGSPVYFDLNVNDEPAGSSTPCPTGTVQFYVNGAASGSPVTLPVACASPLIFESSTLTGSATVSAIYSGDTNYAANTQSTTVTEVISTDTTSVTLAASGTAINPSQSDTFTATITPAPGVTPAGTVNFLDGATVIGTQTLSGTAPYTATYTNSTLAAGTHTISAAYVPSGSDPAGTSSAITVNVSATLTAPVITWATPAAVTYPTALSATQLNATASVPGTFAYAPLSGYTPLGGPINLWVTFTPTDPTTYSTQTALVTLSVNQEAAVVTDWPTASAITYGETLASSNLSPTSAVVPGSATTPGSASVAGTFTWTTPTTVPATGTQTESVTFTPTDTNDYSPITGTVSVTVNQATPTVVFPTANPISVGQALSASTFSGGSASATYNGSTVNVPGVFAWVTPTLVPTPAGTYTESVTFTPTDGTDYAVVTGSVQIVVNSKTTPTIILPPTATAITYGQALSASTLNPVTVTGTPNANASVPGTFTWTTPATVPLAGAAVSESITFTPTDTTDYNTISQNITLLVNKATPTLVAPTASPITVGQLLSASTLTGGSATNPNGGATVLGSFAWTTPTTAPPVGTASYSVTFTPTDTSDYLSTTINVSLVVNAKITPTITTSPTATGIIYGQTLASSTLSGGAGSVGGTFAWSAPATIPPAGTASYSVTFTPTDTTDYNTTTGLVSVTVAKATPTVVPPTASAISSGQTLASSTLSGGSATNPNGGATVLGGFAWTTPGTTPAVGTDSESVTFTPTDAANYNSVIVTVSVVVNNKTTPTVTTWPTASPIVYGAALSTSTLTPSTTTGPPVASVAGTFTWTTPTTVPGAGTDQENVTFTPTNTTLYNTTSQNISITVSQATPTVTDPPTASPITLGQLLASSTLTPVTAVSPGSVTTPGSASVAGTFTWTAPTTQPAAGAQSESVTFTPTDAVDYKSVTVLVTVTVNGVAAPIVSDWPTPSAITYGQTLASSTLTPATAVVPGSATTPGSASVAGTFAWTLSTTAPDGGTQQESVTFTPTDTVDYSTVTTTIAVTVNPATPTVATLPVAAPVSSGQPLSASALTGGTVTFNGNPVAGTFAWTTPTTIPAVGTNSYSVTFTPTVAADYTTLTNIMVSITVNNLTTPTVTVWPTAGPIFYGQTLAASALTPSAVTGTPNANASVPGTFAWTNPGTVPPVGTASYSVTFTPTDTADYNSVAGTVSVTVYASVKSGGYIVTVSTDDAGTAANCTPQTAPGVGTDRSCSLRDALLAAATGGGGITFDTGVFASATTITLSNGTLTVPTSTTLTGPTAGSGATLANLVTVDGGSASTVFTVGSSVTTSAIANLTIQHGKGVAGGIQNAGGLTLTGDTITNNASTGAGAGISNSGTLILSASTVSTNTAAGNGGGIDNTGTLTLTDDTISGNTSSGSGGGIYNNATLSVSDSTISANGAGTASEGGGIDNASPGAATLANAIVGANNGDDDFDGVAYTDSNGNIVGVVNGATVSATAINLAPLGNYGGPTQTMIPVPSSPAICGGVAAGIPSGLTTDQRGLSNTNASYTGYPTCVDAGAVQTNYAMSFTVEPTGAPVGGDIAAAVTLTESGSPFQPPVTIPLTLNGTGTLTGGSTATVGGVATYTLQVDTAGTGDTLTANLTLNGGLTPPVAISTTSNSFTITPTVTATVTLGGLSQTYTGSPLPATATTSPTGLTVTFTYTGTGTTTYPLSSTAPTAAGTYTVVGTVSTAGYQGTGTGTMTIAQAPTTTTLTTSATSGSINPGQSITLTAVVAPSAAGTTGPPTGTVSFYSGTTLLNTTPAPLSAGTATYSTTTLSAGTTDQITAVYSGDNNFLTSTSSGSSIVVAALGFTLTVNAPTSQTVAPGGTATYQMVVAPLFGAPYPGVVSFAATGMPSTATVTFNPLTVAADAGQQTVTMQVQTTTAAAQASPTFGRRLAPLTFALFLLPLVGASRLRRQGRRLSRLTALVLLLGCTLAGTMMTGCGGTIKNAAEKSYTITITATSGTAQQTAQVTLVVQ